MTARLPPSTVRTHFAMPLPQEGLVTVQRLRLLLGARLGHHRYQVHRAQVKPEPQALHWLCCRHRQLATVVPVWLLVVALWLMLVLR
jgi:hypothetical protein